jgi:gliding motility-associated-like protein
MKAGIMNKIKLLVATIILGFAGLSVDAQTYEISDGGTVNTCSGTLYDSGGASGDYGNNETETITICSDNSAPVELTFTSFETESCCDDLIIYDGPNTGNPIIGTYAGSELLGVTVVSSSNCLTLVFDSDGSITDPGWEAEISCLANCQDFTIDWESTDPPITNTDSMWINLCQGESVDFSVEANFPNNNIEYNQTEANTHFEWEVYDGDNNEVYEGDGMTDFSYTFDEEGGYYVTVTATDVNGCENQNFAQLRVRTSLTPIFSGAGILEDTVCPEDIVNLEGYGYVTPIEWSIPVQTEVADTSYLPDGNGVEYTSDINYTVFEPGQTLDNASDLFAICANMEHSYMGDLDIWIECPNGQETMLFEQACGSGWLGEATDGDSSPNPGVGYDYCWTETSSNGTWEDNCPGGSNSLPSGDYEPLESFSNLVGCPLNGTWTIHVLDNLGIDNGYIFSWQLYINPDLIPDDLWSYENEYDTTYSDVNTDVYWTGENIIEDIAGDALAQPSTSGDLDYVLHAVDDFGCTHDTTFTVHVRADTAYECCTTPAADAGPDDEVCSDTYTFHTTLDTAINTVEWSMISGPGIADFGGTETSTDPTVSVDTWGTYTFQLVEQNITPACCDTATVDITFYQTPNAQFSKTPILCYGDTTIIEYEGNASAAASYTWDFDGGIQNGTGQGPIEVYWNDAGLHEITLTVEENGCLSGDTVQTLINPVELTHALTTEDDRCYQACEGWAEVDAEGGTMPYTYSWGANNLNENLCAGNYGITVTDANGCETSETYTISEPAELVVTSSSSQDLSCFNANDGEMHISVSGGTGSPAYNWSDGGTGTDRINMAAGNYEVTVTDQNGCSLTEDFTLTQPDELLISVSPDQALCEGETVNINATAIGGTEPYTYYWDDGSGYFAGSNMLTVSPDTTTDYVVYVEDANGCQSPAASMTITVSPTMHLSLETEDNRCYNSCDGEARLTITGGIQPFNYSWAADGAIYQNICAGMYDVTVTDMLGCQVDTVFFIDQPPQLVGNVYTEPASCYGYDDGLAFVEVSGGTPGYSYLWPDGTQNDSVVIGAGNHTVTVSDAHNCRLELEAEVEEPTQLQLNLLSGDRWICQGNSTSLNAQAIGGTPFTGGTYDFYWTGTDSSSFVVHNPEVSPDTTTTYEVYAEDANGCTSSTDDVTVKVYPDLMIENVTTSYDSICPGDPAIVDVDVSGGNGGPYYMTLQTGDVVPSPFTVYPEETTMYYITLHDECGSPTVTDSIEIIVMPEPENNFVSDRVEGCPPLAVSFNELNEDQGNSYEWSFGDNGFAYTKNPTHIYENEGNYSVSLTVTSPFGCENTRSTENMIEVFPAPVADFYTDFNNVSVLDPEISFVSISENADSTFWFFGDGDSSLMAKPNHIFDGIGEYEVMLIAETEMGCRDTVVKTVRVKDEFTFYAPTAFTPNGDKDNDFFMVYGNGIDPNEFTLRVYDRWGELVFETEEYDNDNPIENAWDGTLLGNRYKGDRLLSPGVYYWYCKFKDYTGIWHEKEGTVNLIR